MGMIVFHAGMAKAGSSSIQRWLAARAATLASEYGVHPMRIVAHGADGGPDVVPATPSLALSELVGVQDPYADVEPVEARRAATRAVFDRLDGLAGDRTVVLTDEGYQLAFWNRDEAFLCELDELARAHRVRVAYYVRPQHTAMEAAWRQWGFRLPIRPSKYLERRIQQFDYLQTNEDVREVAPHVSFEMRPFRDDLLVGGDVVVDFATTFLGAEELTVAARDEQRSNRGLPLELVMMLRGGKDRFWASHHDNDRLDQLRDIVTRWDIPESGQVRRSREVLQGFCHRRFEPGNRRLIEALGWDTEQFVPVPEESTGPGAVDADLAALDELWTSTATDAVRELVFCALAELLSPRRGADAMSSGDGRRGTEDRWGAIRKRGLRSLARRALHARHRP